MDTTVLVLLIIILYLIKEIIRISNKKRYPPHRPRVAVIFSVI